MGRDLRFGVAFESFANREMEPQELRTLRCQRLRPFDQIEGLTEVPVVILGQQRGRSQITGGRVCYEDGRLPIALGPEGLGIRAPSMHTPGQHQGAQRHSRQSGKVACGPWHSGVSARGGGCPRVHMIVYNGKPFLIRWAKRIVISVVGFTVLAIGIAMIVLPGPAIIVIPVGLGILGLEFAWARRWLGKLKERSALVVNAVRSKNK